MAAFLKEVSNCAVIAMLKKRLHEETSMFDVFIEHYHYFISAVRKACLLYINTPELRKMLHLLPFEETSGNEGTVFLEAVPIRSAGLFATRFIQELHKEPQIKVMLTRMVNDWREKGKMDWTDCGKLFYLVGKQFVEEEKPELIKMLRDTVDTLMAEHDSEKELFVYKLVRWLEMFMQLIPAREPGKKLPALEEQIKPMTSSGPPSSQ